MNWLLIVILVLIAGALMSLALAAHQRLASCVGVSTAIAGCAWGEWVAVRSLLAGHTEAVTYRWLIPNAAFSFGLDALSAFFLVPLFGLGGLAACYGASYLRQHAPSRNLSVPWAAYNLIIASMALLLLARHAILFLFAWEVMSLAGYLLVSFDHKDATVRRASFVYLIATHVGVSCLLGMFLLFGSEAQSFEFDAFGAAVSLSATTKHWLFVLGLVGFGTKAGLFPFHVWLPEAHAAAPSHVSALMSGVLIKMGIYGILRLVLLLGDPSPVWGISLMLLGVGGGTIGMGCALYQRDIKRLLAYSSVENIGIVFLGLGAAIWGNATHRPVIAAVGLLGGLLHIWNHAVMKGLMFLGAGSIVHRNHSRDLEQFGGLYRRMPYTATALVVGATALTGLPPLNGFVSEWLVYTGLLRAALTAEGGTTVGLLTLVATLAFIGAMAALCFTRFVGLTLLGSARSERAKCATESSIGMLVPMVVLAATTLVLAVKPSTVVAMLRPVTAQLLGPKILELDLDLGLAQIGTVHSVLLAALVVGVFAAIFLASSSRVASDETWGCGYTAPTSRMQYGGRAFSELFTSNVLPRMLGPKQLSEPVSALFPSTARLATSMEDPLTRSAYEPFLERWANRFVRLRVMQQGVLHAYILYILVTLLLALAFSAFVSMGGPR